MEWIPTRRLNPFTPDSHDILQGICYTKILIAPTIPDNFFTAKTLQLAHPRVRKSASNFPDNRNSLKILRKWEGLSTLLGTRFHQNATIFYKEFTILKFS